jgi:hypothetical protein
MTHPTLASPQAKTLTVEQVRDLHRSLQSQILRLISEFELATSIKVEGIVVHHVTQVGFVQQVQGVTVTAQL